MENKNTKGIDLPFAIGPVHFIGIGGIGMSGIAEIMLTLGYQIQGSDLAVSAMTQRLQTLGAQVFHTHEGAHVEDVSAVVVSSAIKQDNPELVAARAQSIPIVRRAEMLAELMRLKWAVAVGGTHGKTTTTSMVAALLEGAGLDPTVINGGIINAYHTNAKLGQGRWMVVEADESDGSFLKLHPTLSIITNINPEHMEFYENFQSLRTAFDRFIENLPFYGCGIVCTDHAEVQALIGRVQDRRLVSYGLNPQADIGALNIRANVTGSYFDVVFRRKEDHMWRNLFLPMLGKHNVQNVLAAIAVADELGVQENQVRAVLASFEGVKRRFTRVGNWRGVDIIDDYAHHPVEITAVLDAARQALAGEIAKQGEGEKRRVHAIVQPHRYTRLQDCFEEFCTCFNDADYVYIAPVYAAGEPPIEGVDAQALAQALQAHGHRHVQLITRAQLSDKIIPNLVPGDMVLFMGAGDISKWAYEFEQKANTFDDG